MSIGVFPSNPRKLTASVAAILQDIKLVKWVGLLGTHQPQLHHICWAASIHHAIGG